MFGNEGQVFPWRECVEAFDSDSIVWLDFIVIHRVGERKCQHSLFLQVRLSQK